MYPGASSINDKKIAWLSTNFPIKLLFIRAIWTFTNCCNFISSYKEEHDTNKERVMFCYYHLIAYITFIRLTRTHIVLYYLIVWFYKITSRRLKNSPFIYILFKWLWKFIILNYLNADHNIVLTIVVQKVIVPIRITMLSLLKIKRQYIYMLVGFATVFLFSFRNGVYINKCSTTQLATPIDTTNEAKNYTAESKWTKIISVMQ